MAHRAIACKLPGEKKGQLQRKSYYFFTVAMAPAISVLSFMPLEWSSVRGD